MLQTQEPWFISGSELPVVLSVKLPLKYGRVFLFDILTPTFSKNNKIVLDMMKFQTTLRLKFND